MSKSSRSSKSSKSRSSRRGRRKAAQGLRKALRKALAEVDVEGLGVEVVEVVEVEADTVKKGHDI